MIAAALVAALACPAQPAIQEDMDGRVLRTRLVACVGGRRAVVRRARVVRRGAGVRIRHASAAGRWLAWIELRYAGGRATGVVVAARVGRRRVRIVEERVAVRSRARDIYPTVAVTAHGDLAWAARRRLRAARIGEPAVRTLDDDVEWVLGVEDGRTVRWQRPETAELGYTDLRPYPHAGCPPRRRFREIARSDHVLVTKASYGRGPNRATAWRACLRATGADPVITAGYTGRIRVVGLGGQWVVLIREAWASRGCAWARIEAYAAGSAAAGPSATVGCYGLNGPPRGVPAVVTASGVPAWIVRQEGRWALVTTADFNYMTLDATAPGGLTGLVADGTRVRWLHDGEPRSVDLG